MVDQELVTIDGSTGEGGGQVLRTALGLSLATGRPFRLEQIRGTRSRPGLQPQHLNCIHAAREIAGATVDGAATGSTTLQFAPGRVRAGDYHFEVGHAGSTTLLLQTILPGLMRADGPSVVAIGGGTMTPMAPPFDFAASAFRPVLERMGMAVEVQAQRHGFSPLGGGTLRARIAPSAQPRPLELLLREAPGQLRARALLSRLPDEIGVRQLSGLMQRFGSSRLQQEQTRLERHDGKHAGNALLLELPMRSHVEIITAFGARGVPAERVADVVATEALALLAADVPVGPHLADQLLVPMALCGGGCFRTLEPTLHTTTNAALIERFLPVRFAMREDPAGSGRWVVECSPR